MEGGAARIIARGDDVARDLGDGHDRRRDDAAHAPHDEIGRPHRQQHHAKGNRKVIEGARQHAILGAQPDRADGFAVFHDRPE